MMLGGERDPRVRVGILPHAGPAKARGLEAGPQHRGPHPGLQSGRWVHVLNEQGGAVAVHADGLRLQVGVVAPSWDCLGSACILWLAVCDAPERQLRVRHDCREGDRERHRGHRRRERRNGELEAQGVAEPAREGAERHCPGGEAQREVVQAVHVGLDPEHHAASQRGKHDDAKVQEQLELRLLEVDGVRHRQARKRCEPHPERELQGDVGGPAQRPARAPVEASGEDAARQWPGKLTHVRTECDLPEVPLKPWHRTHGHHAIEPRQAQNAGHCAAEGAAALVCEARHDADRVCCAGDTWWQPVIAGGLKGRAPIRSSAVVGTLSDQIRRGALPR